MKLASYNVENLFLRARALNQQDAADGKVALEKQLAINKLFAKPHYSAADKLKILELLEALGLLQDDSGGKFAILRQNRGHLLTRHKNGEIEVVAEGRAGWIGWVDLKLTEVNEVSTRATAHVINELNADIVALVETESRPALVRFNKGLIAPNGGTQYEHIMLIDGNDERGIDVGIMMKRGYDITSMLSHVDDQDQDGEIFSRDCPVYTIKTPKGNTLTVLINHLKSKGFGTHSDSNERRLRQATRVKEIYQALVADGQQLIAVVGDFNDTPDSLPLAPLLQETDLRDISEHPEFDDGGRPGTFKNGTKGEKIDYILLSPALFALSKRGAIFRMGVWGGKHGDLFPHFEEITKEEEAASDHAALWAELDV